MDKKATDGSERLRAISLFYPMFNEEENIEEAARRAISILPKHTETFEVILVNDGSRDATGEIADRLAAEDPRIRAVHHETNLGYGSALRSGIKASRYEWIFYTDGDNQFDLEEIATLLPLRYDNDIVTGYRIARRDPWNRKFNAWLYATTVRILFGLRFRDVDCAFKLYRSEVFTDMELESTGALIDLEIFARAKKAGARIVEIGVNHYPRTAGSQTGAKLSVMLRAVREMFRLWGVLR